MAVSAAGTNSQSIVLSAERVTKRFGDVSALDEVSLTLPRGASLALIGESGSGKTTLLRTFNRLVDPDAGVVCVDGVDVSTVDPVQLRRRIGYVPQDGGLLPHWRVQRNVELVLRLNGAPDAAERARSALTLVGLDPARFADRWPRKLSGGQRQRVAIARALAGEPSLLLLDEPFGALDAITRADLQDAFAGIRERLAMTTVLVTHDLHEALLLATHVAVMRAGKIEQIASPEALVADPATAYVKRLLERARVAAEPAENIS
ncbi:MAG TPA: ATP-binding cassette domain-containing protein [Gemmatimonadaceae bacterium]|nr:ATP-binding cassette domain-containing protein [Gemmatimonadaceae bacterium]